MEEKPLDPPGCETKSHLTVYTFPEKPPPPDVEFESFLEVDIYNAFANLSAEVAGGPKDFIEGTEAFVVFIAQNGGVEGTHYRVLSIVKDLDKWGGYMQVLDRAGLDIALANRRSRWEREDDEAQQKEPEETKND